MHETGGPATRALRHFVVLRHLSLLAGLMAAAPELGAQQTRVERPCTCTREFRSIEVEVVDARGRGVASWQATVRRARDGKVVRRVSGGAAGGSPASPPPVQGRTPVLPEVAGAPGSDGGQTERVVVLDDGMLELLTSRSERFLVEVRAGRRRGTASLVLGYTGSAGCRCHVRLVSGPDRVVVR
jgi:hypothetical protein